jgi:hypothetical protein
MEYLKLIGIAVVIFALGVGVGRHSFPDKKTESQKQETDTEKTVINKETTKPDGTKIKETITTDKKQEKKESLVVIDYKKTQWKVSGLAGYSFDSNKPVYGIDVQRRVLGAAYIGAWGTTDKTVGISLGYEF